MISGAQAMAEHYFLQGKKAGLEIDFKKGVEIGENKVWTALAADCIHRGISKEEIIKILAAAGMDMKEAEQLFDQICTKIETKE